MQTPAELTRLANALNGLPIMGCSAGSPAARAGLRYGDIVLSVNGVPTASWSAFFEASHAVASSARAVRARVFRQGSLLELRLELGGSATPRAVLGAEAAPAHHDLCAVSA